MSTDYASQALLQALGKQLETKQTTAFFGLSSSFGGCWPTVLSLTSSSASPGPDRRFWHVPGALETQRNPSALKRHLCHAWYPVLTAAQQAHQVEKLCPGARHRAPSLTYKAPSPPLTPHPNSLILRCEGGKPSLGATLIKTQSFNTISSKVGLG